MFASAATARYLHAPNSQATAGKLSMCQCDYQLIDFGESRKLERFGRYLVDRPAPTAAGAVRRDAEAWCRADFQFRPQAEHRGCWNATAPGDWLIDLGFAKLKLALSPFGHVGMFPDQIDNWDWLQGKDLQGVRMLNLFAANGGTTLAAAARGASVVHVDAAKNVVARARANAAHSNLQHAPVRWICDDALTFVQRELKRGNGYDAVVLDPPSYGHGPRRGSWKIQRDLARLFAGVAQLTRRRPRILLLTCHSPGYDHSVLQRMLGEFFPRALAADTTARPLTIPAADGRELASGYVVRWSSETN